MLSSNKILRKLDLEGNLLGPKTLAEFGEVLKVNTTLKSLNLESNQLTMDGQDMWGVYKFAEMFDNNQTLLSLNLCNNQMDEKCGSIFKEKIQVNETLIDFDFSMNSFNMQESRDI